MDSTNSALRVVHRSGDCSHEFGAEAEFSGAHVHGLRDGGLGVAIYGFADAGDQRSSCRAEFSAKDDRCRVEAVAELGATYKDIRVTNYFYADTVEQKVYEGIAQDYDDFTEIVGNAQPVLAAVEMAIEQLVFALPANRDHDITESVAKIREDITRVGDRAVQYSDIGKIAVIPPPVLVGDVTLDTLEQVLITNPLTATRFTTVDGRDGVYRLALNGDTKSTVTFRRKAADDASDDTTLLTYGNPVLNALFEDVRTATSTGI